MGRLGREFQRGRRNLQMHLVRLRAAAGARSRGAKLPPGELRIPDESVLADQTYFLKRAEELGPIFKVWAPHKMTTCIVGNATGRRFLSENDGRIRGTTADLSPLFPHGFLRSLEGTIHRKYRRLVLDAFRGTPLDPSVPAIRETIRKHLDVLANEPQPVTAPVIRQVLKDAATEVFLRLILGVTPRSPLCDALTKAHDVYAPDGPFVVMRPRHHPAYAAIRELVLRQVESLKTDDQAGPSLLRYVVRAGTLDEAVLGNIVHMVEVVRYDIHSFWFWLVKMLSDRPDVVAHVRSAPQIGASGLKISEAIAREALRMEQIEFLHRAADEDIVFDGYFIPKGSRIRICIWEAHHDPRKFQDPFRFNCERFMKGKVPADDYSPFGLDKHLCLGADWTFDLSAVFVEELVSHYRWEKVADGPPVRGKFHFEPSPKFTISFARDPQSTDPAQSN
jgi:cytochrome P450